MKMREDNNCPHQLSLYTDAVSKNHYPHMRMRIVVLEYVDVVINRIAYHLYIYI
jgi:hypothetical protein